MKSLIKINNLSYKYGEFLALNSISYTIQSGEVVGLLGPNGAGKTTTVRLINGLLKPASGQIEIFGLDPSQDGEKIRRKTGVLTETPALYERLSAVQNLNFFGTMASMTSEQIESRSDELLSFFNLKDRADDLVGTYSKGMKQRLALARAILHSPEVLFLDEPTSGLDPEAALRVHQLIQNISKSRQQTVMICTHNLYEAQALCDRIIILEKGSLLANGALDDLRNELFPEIRLEIGFLSYAESYINFLKDLSFVSNVELIKPDLFMMNVLQENQIPMIVTGLVNQGAQIKSVFQKEVSLDEIYFSLQHKGN